MTVEERAHGLAAAVSRRDAIMGALALAAGTLVASRPDTALAANGDPLLIGADNTTTSQTQLVRTEVGGGAVTSVAGMNMLWGGSHFGLYGVLQTDVGPNSAGVAGIANYAKKPGVFAMSTVLDGIGLKASAPYGIAVAVDGPLRLSRSGLSYVSKGRSSATVTVATGVESTSLILATLQGSAGTGVYLSYAKRTGATTFQVVLNKAAAAKVYFAWMIVERP